MFVLLSKKKPASTAPSSSMAPAPKATTLVRTPNACDACRISKAKCDSHLPCGRCQQKQLVCSTSSRRHLKALGPISEDHVATLQVQQRRLLHAISQMDQVIKQAELRGFVEEGGRANVPPLSSLELAELLQKFGPEKSLAEASDSPPNAVDFQTKKRKLDLSDLSEQRNTDVFMTDDTHAINTTKDYRSFEKFLSTVQQLNNGNLGSTMPMHQTTTDISVFALDCLEGLANPRMEASVFDSHPQLAPFMDLVDRDASLEHFLDDQHDSSSLEWSSESNGFGMSDATSWHP